MPAANATARPGRPSRPGSSIRTALGAGTGTPTRPCWTADRPLPRPLGACEVPSCSWSERRPQHGEGGGAGRALDGSAGLGSPATIGRTRPARAWRDRHGRTTEDHPTDVDQPAAQPPAAREPGPSTSALSPREHRWLEVVLVLGAIALLFIVLGQLAGVWALFSDLILIFFFAWLLGFILEPIAARLARLHAAGPRRDDRLRRGRHRRVRPAWSPLHPPCSPRPPSS